MEKRDVAKEAVEKFGPLVPKISCPGWATREVHVGNEPDPQHGSMSAPIHLASTFAQLEPGKPYSNYTYSRASNPTVDRLIRSVASLEGAKFGAAAASFMGAMTAVLATLKTGDHVISVEDVYIGTSGVMSRIFSKFGVESSFVDLKNAEELRKHLRPNTKLLILESPSNPMFNIYDIKALCSIAREHKVMTIIDNTVATPYLQNPIDLGVDFVLHSGTKYLGGHSDVISGYIVSNDEEKLKEIRSNIISMGACLSAIDAWMVLRSIRTLKPRMEVHCYNAFIIAHYLHEHPKVKSTFYPGLSSHPNHEIAKRQMRSYGGMISMDPGCSIEQVKAFLKGLKVFTLADSLGGVESLINVPALMNYASMPKEWRQHLGITDTMMRISVGIEDVEDLINDLEAGFAQIKEE